MGAGQESARRGCGSRDIAPDTFPSKEAQNLNLKAKPLVMQLQMVPSCSVPECDGLDQR